MKNVYKKFDSLQQFDMYLAQGTTQAGMKEYSMLENASRTEFTTTASYAEAQHKMTTGDADNAKRIERAGVAKERTKIRCTADKRQMYASPVGFLPHVPNYIAGVPCNMINERRMQVKHKVITLVYNVSVGGSASATEMRDVAARMLSAIMRAEAQGVRINLYVCDISVSGEQEIGWLLRIKTSGQHLDVLKTAYPLVNPSMLRRHSFRFTEVTKGVSKRFSGNYGGASNNVSNLLKACGLSNAKTLSYYNMRTQTANEILRDILS